MLMELEAEEICVGGDCVSRYTFLLSSLRSPVEGPNFQFSAGSKDGKCGAQSVP